MLSFGKYSSCSFCWAATSFAGIDVLSAPPWCVLSMLCSTIHVNTMSLTTHSLCSMVHSSTLKWLTKIQQHSCFWRYCSWLFFLPLSVALCYRVLPSMASSQRCRHQARSSGLALPLPGVQMLEAPSCHPQSSP